MNQDGYEIYEVAEDGSLMAYDSPMEQAYSL